MTTHPQSPLLALSEKATPGPFTVEDADDDGSVYFICVQHPDAGTVSIAETRAGCDEASEMGGNPEANALFLVAAANYVRANVKALANAASELPKLPEPAMREANPYLGMGSDPYGTQNLVWYSADQMRAYATEAAAYWREMWRAANARGDDGKVRLWRNAYVGMLTSEVAARRCVGYEEARLLAEEAANDMETAFEQATETLKQKQTGSEVQS